VQNLILLLTIISFLTANMYYLALFVKKHPEERSSSAATNFSFLNQLSSLTSVDNTSGEEEFSSYDEDMLHYLIWLCFYIDLPLLTARIVLWTSHGVPLSLFIVKDIKMITVVLTMMVKHSKIVSLMTAS